MAIISLFHFNGVDYSTEIIDDCNGAAVINGGVRISTGGYSEFGGASGYFDGAANTWATSTIYTPVSLTDFAMSFCVCASTIADSYIWQLNGNNIRCRLTASGDLYFTGTNSDGSAFSTLASDPINISRNTLYRIRLEMISNQLNVYKDGTRVITSLAANLKRDNISGVTFGDSSGGSGVSLLGFIDEFMLGEADQIVANGAASYTLETIEFTIPERTNVYTTVTGGAIIQTQMLAGGTVDSLTDVVGGKASVIINLLANPLDIVSGTGSDTRIGIVQTLQATTLDMVPDVVGGKISSTWNLSGGAVDVSSDVVGGNATSIAKLLTSGIDILSDVVGGTIGVSHLLLATGIDIVTNFFVDSINYLAVTYSVENQSVTTWSNFKFNASTFFNGVTLMANESGLYEIGGTTDNGTAIKPSLKTGRMSEGSFRFKRIPRTRIELSAQKTGGSVDLVVTADSDSYRYTQAIAHDKLSTHEVRIGRGIKYRTLQLEISANSCTMLNIDSISYEPVELRRIE